MLNVKDYADCVKQYVINVEINGTRLIKCLRWDGANIKFWPVPRGCSGYEPIVNENMGERGGSGEQLPNPSLPQKWLLKCHVCESAACKPALLFAHEK